MSTLDPVRFVAKNMRVDLALIAEMIAPGSRVLDIGCGDGTLIDHLFQTKGCDARGIEIDMAEVTRAVAHGLPVMHGDADIDLAHYPDGAFDYVVLSRTLQAVERPRAVLRQMLRIGTRAVVSFPNFGHWLVRWQLAVHGPDADDRDLGPAVARDAEHPSRARSATSSPCARKKVTSWNDGSPRMTPAGARRGAERPEWPTCSGSKACSCCGADRDPAMPLRGLRRMDSLAGRPPRRRPRRIRRAVLISLLIHVTIGILLLVTIRREEKEEQLPPASAVTMLFESGRKNGPTLPNPEEQTAPSSPPAPALPPSREVPLPTPPVPPPAEIPPLATPMPTPPETVPTPPEPTPPVPTPPVPAPPNHRRRQHRHRGSQCPRCRCRCQRHLNRPFHRPRFRRLRLHRRGRSRL